MSSIVSQTFSQEEILNRLLAQLSLTKDGTLQLLLSDEKMLSILYSSSSEIIKADFLLNLSLEVDKNVFFA